MLPGAPHSRQTLYTRGGGKEEEEEEEEKRGENIRVGSKKWKKTQKISEHSCVETRNVPKLLASCVIFSRGNEASGCGVQAANTLIQSRDLAEEHFGSSGVKVTSSLFARGSVDKTQLNVSF